MNIKQDVSINIPTELLDELSSVIRIGIQRAKISKKSRKELSTWWAAESDFINEDLYSV